MTEQQGELMRISAGDKTVISCYGDHMSSPALTISSTQTIISFATESK